jgi:CRP-like cAMP-binding protein
MKQADISDENLRLIDTLKKLPIFNTLDDFRLKDLLKLCKLRQYEKGERIFEENTFDNYIFFLVSGKVRIERNGIALGFLRRLGDAYGIVEVIDAKPRPASIYAEEDTVCILMDAAYMDRLPEKDKAVQLYIVYRIFTEVLSERLRSTTEELIKTKEELARAASGLLQPG